MRQVLESDKKIHALSLLKFSKISLSQIDDAIQADCTTTMQTDADSAPDLITCYEMTCIIVHIITVLGTTVN